MTDCIHVPFKIEDYHPLLSVWFHPFLLSYTLGHMPQFPRVAVQVYMEFIEAFSSLLKWQFILRATFFRVKIGQIHLLSFP